MQRSAIARAVFSEHPILMLDEATSALDETTARQLLENLRRMTDKTVLMVTHRADQADFLTGSCLFPKMASDRNAKQGNVMKFWKSKTFAVGVIIVCSALLIELSWMNRQQERRRLAQMRALQQQAAPYEQEIREIQSELSKREKAISANTDISGAVPCFQISSAKDIEVVKELSAGRTFTPTILLNCSLGKEVLRDIIKASAAENYEFVLFIRSMQDDTLDTAAELQEIIAEYTTVWEPVVLLRNQADTKATRALLAQHGYQTLFRYRTDLDNGAQDETLYLSYGFILATTSSSRLTAMLTSAHTSMAICFDLDNLHDHTLAEKDITDCLNVLDEYVSEKKLEYRDADTAFWVLAQKEGRAERAKAEFDRYAQQQKARIKELQDIISEIYSH